MYYDTHCHLDFHRFDDDRHEVLHRMREDGVMANTVGVDAATSRAALDIARANDHVYAVVGQHPVDNPNEAFDAAVYRDLVADENVVAVGECGLDYYRLSADDTAERARQREVFEAQVAFALETNKPLMLHCRPTSGTMDAYEETLDILEAHGRTAGGALCGTAHFFVGTWDVARRFFDIGFYVSYPGIVTFVREFDDVIRDAPADRLLAETDAPFAAPEPYRGKRNEPVYVQHVARKIAELRGEPLERMEEQLVENGKRLFGV